MGSALDEYLSKGISAANALQLLKDNDCLTFPQLKSGLFPAANFDHLENDETGMSHAWLRDTSCIGIILLQVNQTDEARAAAEGVIAALTSVQGVFESIVQQGTVPSDDTKRPPVRFVGQRSMPLYEWANAQNDALGYCLQFIGESLNRDIIKLTDKQKQLVELIVDYLDVIQYWEDADSGHWEEVKKVNASSIGTVIGGLKAVRPLVSDIVKVAALIDKGTEVLDALVPNESATKGRERNADSALVFLVEPRRVVKDEQAYKIVQTVEKTLIGERGIKRYVGDSYWGPDYREHFPLGVRTADFSDLKDMALRDSYLTAGNEAQWTLADPLLSAYYAHRYQVTRDSQDAYMAHRYIVRALRNVIVHRKESGEEVWRIPELFFLEHNEWVPDDHLGLLWSQATLLYGLTVYSDAFGNAPIKK